MRKTKKDHLRNSPSLFPFVIYIKNKQLRDKPKIMFTGESRFTDQLTVTK